MTKPNSEHRNGAEGMVRCPDCGVALKKKNLRKHLKKKHADRDNRIQGPKPGRKPSQRFPSLADKNDEELSMRLREINRELARLAPGFHARRIQNLTSEKRTLVRELRSRKASGLSNQWGRWYGGQGKVRHWRPPGR